MTSKRLNPWSIVAILCAVGLCPLFSIAAILAGARALVEIKARNDTTGVRLAWISICLGALITGLWGGGMFWWNTNVRSMIEQGPIHAIIEGQSGDVEAFTALFVQDTSPEDASQFLHELHLRYGVLQRGNLADSMDETAVDGDNLFLGMVPIEAEFIFELVFSDNTMVSMHAKFELFRDVNGGSQFTNRYAWLIIHDEEQGSLIYPADAIVEGTTLHAK